MNTTTHPFTKEEVMAFLDGELSSDHAQSLSAHLDQCPSALHLQLSSEVCLANLLVGRSSHSLSA